MSGILCGNCHVFFPRSAPSCNACGWERPKHQTEAQRIDHGCRPRVLEKLPLAPPGKVQRWKVVA